MPDHFESEQIAKLIGMTKGQGRLSVLGHFAIFFDQSSRISLRENLSAALNFGS
jgi:hypothetical protein